MRTYNSFVTEKINKKFAPKNLTSIDALKRGIQTQAEIDAAADAAKDINKSGKLGKVTPEVKNELKKIKNRFFTDKPDSETLKVKPTDDQGQFRRKANRVVDRPLKKTIPGKSKKVTVGALDKRDVSIKKLDDVTIKPQKGDAKKTENLIKKLEKDITKPKRGEVSKSRELIKQLKTLEKTLIWIKNYKDFANKKITFKSAVLYKKEKSKCKSKSK